MLNDLLRLIDRTLALQGRGLELTEESMLMGVLPELDSIGVVSLIGAMEDYFGITVDDDEIDAHTFASVGSLQAFVNEKLGTA